jgi:hypothetical protein
MACPTNDRRKHQRIGLRLVVQLRGVEGAMATGCVTQNISSAGFYFYSPVPLIRGERVKAFLALPACRESHAETGAGISCDIRVLRIDPLGEGSGFGIACQIERYTIIASEEAELGLATRSYA